MRYTVTLRKNETGEVRISKRHEEWGPSEFWWTEGNMGCDCNRHLEWLRAGGPGPVGDPHHNNAERECGEGAYSALHATLSDGTIVPLDSGVQLNRQKKVWLYTGCDCATLVPPAACDTCTPLCNKGHSNCVKVHGDPCEVQPSCGPCQCEDCKP